jgi:hypothetical protein
MAIGQWLVHAGGGDVLQYVHAFLCKEKQVVLVGVAGSPAICCVHCEENLRHNSRQACTWLLGVLSYWWLWGAPMV